MKNPQSIPLSVATWGAARTSPSPATDSLDLALSLAATTDKLHASETELIATLRQLQQLNSDNDTLAATLLHALQLAGVELTREILAAYPAVVRDLLEGQQAAEKVWSLYAAHSSGGNAEGLRRLLLAIIRDLRVVFILLARQLVRLRSAGQLPPEQQRALAKLTADIHAPLANRLGIWQLKWELEDLALRYAQPEVYLRIVRLLDERREDRETFIRTTIASLQHALADNGITAELAGRPKHIYSIWRKMSRKGGDFSALYDIRAIRVLVSDVATCYAALGIVHSLWSHVPGEFDDYIAHPKGNNYQSLHTAVIGPEGKTLEIQIRSHDMHAHAELGVAAHWRYKEGGGGDASFERKIAWMRQLLESKDEREDADSALLAGFRTDMLEDRVYLLTPRGQVMDLPSGATVLDFAYHVHTDVGHRCRGAKVNGRIVPLGFQPGTGDRVEILTGKVIEPHRDWLSPHHGYLHTHRARDKVRAWFRHVDLDANLAAGRALFERELKRLALGSVDIDLLPAKFQLQTHEELLVALAIGDIGTSQLARALHEQQAPRELPKPTPPPPLPRTARDSVTIEGVGNLLSVIARCCQPLPGDAIVGFITKGRGVSIHRADCGSLAHLRARDPNRVIEVEWGGTRAQSYEVDVVLRGYDRKSLHKDVTTVIAAANVHMLAVDARVENTTGIATMRFALRVNDYGQLSALLAQLSGVPNIIEARRLA